MATHHKGFGFVTPHKGGKDVYFHVKENGGDDAFQYLKAGDPVSYVRQWDDRRGNSKVIYISGPSINASAIMVTIG